MKSIPWFCISLGLIACGFPTSSPEQSRSQILESYDWVTISASNKTLFLGSTLWSSTDELPRRPVQLSNNFFISKSEITRKQFFEVLGWLPDSMFKDSLPITRITWYDAIAFCNALSKKTGFDTVYSFEITGRSEDGSIHSIRNLQIDLNKIGIRLPTEAEWIYAGSGGTDQSFPWGNDTSESTVTQYAYYKLNSQSQIHPIAQKQALHGLYDMAGNAMEWTQDFLNPLDTVLIRDYAGGPISPSSSEIVVKGGSWAHEILRLRLGSRRESYPIFATTRTSYIGFRIVQGQVTNPIRVDASGIPVLSNDESWATATIQDINQFFQTPLVRLAYSQGWNHQLRLIDYSMTLPRILNPRVPQTVPQVHPSFSPNGEWIAWSNRMEGQSGSSLVSISSWKHLLEQSLNAWEMDHPWLIQQSSSNQSHAIPRWWLNATTQDTFLITASTSQSNQDSTQWIAGSTLKTPWNNAQAQWNQSSIITQGSFHGGMSQDSKFMITGSTKLIQKNLTSQVLRSLGNRQICNVSMSPDSSGRMVYLDFGSSQPAHGVDQAYGIHEYLFYSDSNANTIAAYKAPTGYIGWDHTEFSNDPRFVIASAWNESEERSAIFAINLISGEMLKLVNGTTIENPALWIQKLQTPLTSAELDSFAVYHEIAGLGPKELSSKNRLYWLYRDQIDAVILGSSRIQYGIEIPIIGSLRIVNLAFQRGHSQMIPHIWNLYFNNPRQIRLVIFSIDPDHLWIPDLTDGIISQSLGYQYDKAHQIPNLELTADQKLILTKRFRTVSTLGFVREDGTTNTPCQTEPLAATIDPGSEQWTGDTTWWNDQLNMLFTWMNTLEQQNIRAVGVIIPMYAAYKNSTAFGKYGPDRNTATKIIERIQSYQTANPHFLLVDMNKMGNHDFQDVEFTNSDHLCNSGGLRVADTIAKSVLNRWPDFGL